VPLSYEIKVGVDTIAFIYKPIACHSYNMINIHGEKIKVATIDTMLSFYLAFLYTDRPYYKEFSERILCMSKFLFEVQEKNRLQQKGLLKRFSIICYGHQETLEEIRANKSEKYKELKKKNEQKVFEEWFLNYKPDESNKKDSMNEKSENKSNKKKSLKYEKNKTKKIEKKNKSIFSKFYGKKTRKNKKSLY
jgi:hypothetical protein